MFYTPFATCANPRIVPIQTRYPPENVLFEIADVTEGLSCADASVDVVHARMACLSVRHLFITSLPVSMTRGPF
jgi:hypothetical protein